MSYTCCFRCEKRQPGCHSSCEDYLRAKAEYEKNRELLRKYLDKRIESRSYINEHYDRRRR